MDQMHSKKKASDLKLAVKTSNNQTSDPQMHSCLESPGFEVLKKSHERGCGPGENKREDELVEV